MDKKIEKEIERIKRAKLRKKSLVDFYKITSLQREEFKTKIGLGKLIFYLIYTTHDYTLYIKRNTSNHLLEKP